MKYVVIDPSGSYSNEGKGHTGIAVMTNDDWKGLNITSIAAKDYSSRLAYWLAVIKFVVDESTTTTKDQFMVIIESFMIRNNGFLIGKMPETIRFIGAMELYFGIKKINYIFQAPTQAKARFKDEKLSMYIPEFELQANGRYYFRGHQTNDHVRDALKHLLYFKRYGIKKGG